MIKSAAFALLSLATAVLAQSSAPSNQCQTFLQTLNTDQSISGCLNALIGATSDFDPSNTATNATSAAITAALNKICPSSFTACDESKIRMKLAEFYTQCQADLLGTNGDGTNGNKDVVNTYDVLYLLVPLKNAICSRDTDGKFCVNKMTPATSTSASASGTASGSAASSSTTPHARRYIEPYKRDIVARGPADGTNSTSGQLTLGGLGNQSEQMRNDGLPYLFMTSTTPDSELCTHCTAEVVGAYIAFENVTPYALGLTRSPILSGQSALWQRLKTCNGGQLVRDIINTAVGTETQYNAAFAGAGVNTWLVGGAALLFGATALF